LLILKASAAQFNRAEHFQSLAYPSGFNRWLLSYRGPSAGQ